MACNEGQMRTQRGLKYRKIIDDVGRYYDSGEIQTYLRYGNLHKVCDCIAPILSNSSGTRIT